MGRPTGVTVIAVLDFIAAGFCLLGGIGMLVGGGFLATMMNQQQGAGAGIFAAIGAAAGVFFLVLAALAAFIGWGMLKLKGWARIITIVLSALGILGALLGLFGAFAHFGVGVLMFTVIRLAINGWILWYMLQPNVKAAFDAPQARAAGA